MSVLLGYVLYHRVSLASAGFSGFPWSSATRVYGAAPDQGIYGSEGFFASVFLIPYNILL